MDIELKLKQIKELNIEIEELQSDIERMDLQKNQPDGYAEFSKVYKENFIKKIREILEEEINELDREIANYKERLDNLDTEFEEKALKEKQDTERILEQMVQKITKSKNNQSPSVETAEEIAENPEAKETAEKARAKETVESTNAQEVKETTKSDDLDELVDGIKRRKMKKSEDEISDSSTVNKESIADENTVNQETLADNDKAKDNEKVIEGFWDEIANSGENKISNDSESAISNSDSGEKASDGNNKSQYPFIVGKFAGENLMDRSGKLIIAKNEMISEEVVEKAQAEGKLVDLIIDMKFQ